MTPNTCQDCGAFRGADRLCLQCDVVDDVEPDEDADTDPTLCPTCGGHGGGPDAALRCHECRGSGRVRAGDDDERDYDPSDGAPWGLL